MAYSLGARFPPTPKYFTLLDPGAYQNDKSRKKQNIAPFLSKSPRNIHLGVKLWTHAIYNQSLPRKIKNCSALLSKQPRFPYEAFSEEDLEEILCKCGIFSPCDCSTGKEEVEGVICQGKVRRCIFKGPTPLSLLGDEGLSAPSRKDHGFKILTDGTQRRIREEVKEECPPFYDARVCESTSFYQGCKWGHRTSKRTKQSLEQRPGPADYFYERKPNKNEICAEKVRAFKRKTSKQLRFIEMIQQREINEDRPGPTTYSPMLPKGTNLKFLGTKAKRFPLKYDVYPGPADHMIKRDFDPEAPPDILCFATLPEPACFGTKASRFKTQREEGPSPATYDANYKLCSFHHSCTAPFNSSAKRFKEVEQKEESDEEEIMEMELTEQENNEETEKPCPKLTWEFKSKTVRMQPLDKKSDEPSPADLPQHQTKIERSLHKQYIAPFFSSEGRFQEWYNWIPIHGAFKTPGPAKYCLEKPKCSPAFTRGPLCRAERFPKCRYQSPAPNKYEVNYGIEKILETHNHRLKNNIKNQYKFHWKQPETRKNRLSYEEQEQLLLYKSLALLDSDEETTKNQRVKITKEAIVTKKPKLLRTFLYAHPLETYF